MIVLRGDGDLGWHPQAGLLFDTYSLSILKMRIFSKTTCIIKKVVTGHKVIDACYKRFVGYREMLPYIPLFGAFPSSSFFPHAFPHSVTHIV